MMVILFSFQLSIQSGPWRQILKIVNIITCWKKLEKSLFFTFMGTGQFVVKISLGEAFFNKQTERGWDSNTNNPVAQW